MEAGTAMSAGRLERSGPAHLAEPGPGFIHPEEHARHLDELRAQAHEAEDFHGRKLREAQAVIASVDSALSTLSEVRSKDEQPPVGRY